MSAVAIVGLDRAALARAQNLVEDPEGPVVHLIGQVGFSEDGLLHRLLASARPGALVVHNAPAPAVRREGGQTILTLARGRALHVDAVAEG